MLRAKRGHFKVSLLTVTDRVDTPEPPMYLFGTPTGTGKRGHSAAGKQKVSEDMLPQKDWWAWP